MDATYLSEVKPLSYELSITLTSLTTFSGHVTITLRTKRSAFFLHKSGLLHECSVNSAAADVKDFSHDVIEVSLPESNQNSVTPTIADSTPDHVCSRVLQLQFSGTVNSTTCRGLYMVQSTAAQLQLCTHLEPAHARKLFPCLDLPDMKATFKLVLHGIPAGMTAVSNTLMASQSMCEDGTSTIAFEETPVMSTYLLGKTCLACNCHTSMQHPYSALI
jgi:aminopeptidase N